jgi:diguanylate cyclase (GGDEF)-like protein/PAS domain S-box-containing protein
VQSGGLTVSDDPVGPADVARRAPPVLVVNDRVAQRVALRAMLAPLGLDIVEADSGRSALRAVLSQEFALILMDVRMPSMDGYETAALIRQRKQTRETPIIFITAFGREDTETVTAYASGAADFIFTPVRPDVLRAKVSVFVDLFVKSSELRRSLDSITALNDALRDSEASTQAVLDNVADGILTAGKAGLIESLNRSARQLFGYRDADVIGRPLAYVVAPGSPDPFRELEPDADTNSTTSDTERGRAETLGVRQDGSTFPMEVEHGKLTRGQRRSTLVFVRDISERKAYTEGLEHQALHDGLTGLANRTLFGEHVFQALASAARTGEPRAVLLMDLNAFKQVNDTLGHEYGDALLKQVAERLRGALREADTIARLGGDEFAILPGGATDLDTASEVAWKVQQTLSGAFQLSDELVPASASIGIALFPDHGKTVAELLHSADIAMYGAKRAGSGYAVCDTAIERHATDRLELMADLRECIARDQLVLHYQPKVDLTTGEISGVEALLRWQHPVRGLLAASQFMAEMERTELILPVTRWVLAEALAQARVWREQGLSLTMAVNISTRSLGQDSTVADSVAEVIATSGTPPHLLTLEITEDALGEASASEILNRLHETGVTLSIAHYGTGRSSLAELQHLPIDEIKIDRSFVAGLARGGDDAVIVRSAIAVGHNLGLSVVAEGVEDQATLGLLMAHGCNGAQGDVLTRPCPVAELTSWLTESPPRVAVSASL